MTPAVYGPLIRDIDDFLVDRGIDAQTHVIHFTGNVGHRHEVSKVTRFVNELKNQTERPVVLVGHSMGAFAATQVASSTNVDALVQIAGHFNSQGGMPYDKLRPDDVKCPFLTLLFGNDARLPVTRAILDVDDYAIDVEDPKNALIVLPHFEHSSGIVPGSSSILRRITRYWHDAEDVDDEKADAAARALVAHRVAVYLEYVLKRSSRARLSGYVRTTMTNYAPFLESRRRFTLRDDVARHQESVYKNDGPVDVVDANQARTLYGGLLAAVLAAYPRVLSVGAFGRFVFSHGAVRPPARADLVRTNMFTPRESAWSSAMQSGSVTSPPVWVKFKTSPTEACNTTAQILNERTFAEALSEVSETQRTEYERHARKLVFGPDIRIPPWPFCSVAWLLTPIVLRIADNSVVVRSPVLVTPPGSEEYDSCFNAKILTKRQCLEWILCKSF